MNILHQGPGFLLAELPEIESGVKHLVSIVNGQVLLHKVLAGAATISQEMNLTLMTAILQAANSVIQ